MLTLELTDEVYDSLIEAGQIRGEAPVAVATQLLTDMLSDPLMRLAGSLSSPVSDVSERHDEYIGEGLLRSCRDSD
jgi:hypothetical protein